MLLNRRQFLATGTIGLVGATDRELIAGSLTSQRGLKQGGHLTLGTRHNAIGLDSHRFPRGRTHSPIAAIYSGLTDIDRMGDIIPSMAEWYEPGQNLMTWTFRLRRGALFHNGREVDADSVKQNILRLKTTTVGTGWRGGVSHIESVEIWDKYTVHFNLCVPNAALPAGVMHGLQAPDTFHQAKDHPIGTGPFKLVSWKRHDETRLTRFENYWETNAEGTVLPYLDAITGQYKPEPESRYAALRSGVVDMVDDLTPTQATSLKQASGNQADANHFQLWRVHSGGISLAFNWRRDPFRDQRLRLAAALAIDREVLHRAVFSAQGDILNQPYPPGSLWHLASIRGLTYDPDQSRWLLRQARAMGTEVVMISGMGQSDRRQCTELIQQMWNDVGFKVRVDPLFGGQRQARMRAGMFDAYIHRHPYDADPDHFYRRYFHSGSPDSKRVSGWYNARFDQLIEAANSTIDRSQRRALYAEATQIINRELPSFHLHDVTATVAAVKALKGFEPGKVSSLTYQGGGIRTGYFES